MSENQVQVEQANSSADTHKFSVKYGNKTTSVTVTNDNFIPGAETAIIHDLKTAASDPNFESMPGKPTYLQRTAENAKNNYYSTDQQAKIDFSSIEGNEQLIYGDKYDYRSKLNANDIKATALGQPLLNDIGPIAEIKSNASSNSAPGIANVDKTTTITGPELNLYANINPNKYGPPTLFETIGGADLCVFIIMEVPNIEDLTLPVELQRKELLTIEVDNTLSLSYSTTRERFPVRVLGNSNPTGMTRGPRTISGHIAFAIFTEDILSRLRSRFANEVAKIETTFKEYKPESLDANFKSSETYSNWLKEKQYYNKSFLNLRNKIQLLDDLPPFHILCMGANESGIFSKFMIKNVHIIDENQYQGTQQPNIVNKVTWVAEDIVPMHKIENWNNKSVIASSMNSSHDSYSRGKYSGNINYNYEVTGSSLLDDITNDLRKEY